ncbi:hypothetical protein OSTOST_21848, partial [Ostertagia ostertagi]
VQSKRSSFRDGPPNLPLEFNVDKEKPSTSAELVPPTCHVEFETHNTIFRPIPIVNPVYSVDSAYPRSNLVYKVLHNYRKMYADRWAMELTVPGREGAPSYNASGKIITLCNLNRLSDIMRRQMPYILQFILETFDDFATFDNGEQNFYNATSLRAVLQQLTINVFMSRFWELEGSYWTYRNLPAQQVEKFVFYICSTNEHGKLT